MAGYGVAEFIMSMSTEKDRRAMQQREMKFKELYTGPLMAAQTKALETETQLAGKKLKLSKREQRFREQYQGPYMDALANYQQAMTEKMSDTVLQEWERQFAASRAALSDVEVSAKQMQLREWKKGLNSDDPAVRKTTSDAIQGIKTSQDLSAYVGLLNAQSNQMRAYIDALTFENMKANQERDKLSDMLSLMGNPAISKIIEKAAGEKETEAAKRKAVGEYFGVEPKPVEEESGWGWRWPPWSKSSDSESIKADLTNATADPNLEGALSNPAALAEIIKELQASRSELTKAKK